MDLKKVGTSSEKTKKKRRLKFGIKQKLIIYFLAVAIIPVVGITIFSTLSLTESYTSDRLNQLDAIGANKAEAMTSWFDERKGDCDLMTEIPTVSEWAEIAGTWGHAQKADAILLEPVMKLEVIIPSEFFGDIIGDLSSRRGKVDQTDDRQSLKIIDANIPLSEMFGYATTLRSLTEGRGNFTMEFDSYEEVPGNIAQEIIEGKRR